MELKLYAPAEKKIASLKYPVYTNEFIKTKQTGVMVLFKALFSIWSNKYILKHNSLLMCET